MALKDFSPVQVEILVRHSEHSHVMTLLCDFLKDEAGNDAKHWEVGIRGHFFTEEDLAKALDLFSNQDKGVSYFDRGDKLTFQRFSGSGPSILVANIGGKSITEGEAKIANDFFLRKENIAKNAFGKLFKD